MLVPLQLYLPPRLLSLTFGLMVLFCPSVRGIHRRSMVTQLLCSITVAVDYKKKIYKKRFFSPRFCGFSLFFLRFFIRFSYCVLSFLGIFLQFLFDSVESHSIRFVRYRILSLFYAFTKDYQHFIYSFYLLFHPFFFIYLFISFFVYVHPYLLRCRLHLFPFHSSYFTYFLFLFSTSIGTSDFLYVS